MDEGLSIEPYVDDRVLVARADLCQNLVASAIHQAAGMTKGRVKDVANGPPVNEVKAAVEPTPGADVQRALPRAHGEGET